MGKFWIEISSSELVTEIPYIFSLCLWNDWLCLHLCLDWGANLEPHAKRWVLHYKLYFSTHHPGTGATHPPPAGGAGLACCPTFRGGDNDSGDPTSGWGHLGIGSGSGSRSGSGHVRVWWRVISSSQFGRA